MYYLAVDIGASSGRHILGKYENGKLELTEIYRFENGVEKRGDKLFWNIDKLFENVLLGIKQCSKIGIVPYSIGIDTWVVDYALIDENDKIVDGEVYSYRDSRTTKMIEEVEKIIPFENLYKETGILKANYNTIYQLYADKLSGKLQKAKKYLSVPDLLHYYLTGVMKNEYTHATTTGMVNAKNRTWSLEIIEKLGFPKDIFGELSLPGTVVGNLKEEIQKEVGFNSLVVFPPSHDTASAVMAVPSLSKYPLYISSGTWSLLGSELSEPITSEEAFKFNVTNEGGFNGTITLLKNITGMWVFQNIKRELKGKYSYDELMNMAIDEKDIDSIIDLNDDRFLAPESMIETIKDYCKEKSLKVPNTISQVVKVVYLSLATIYAETVKNLQKILNVKFDTINILGGGSKDSYLNALTKEMTGLNVIAGPTEGTAIGNLLSQAISSKEIKDVSEGRKVVANSFEVVNF